jgi:hypothetical protein
VKNKLLLKQTHIKYHLPLVSDAGVVVGGREEGRGGGGVLPLSPLV